MCRQGTLGVRAGKKGRPMAITISIISLAILLFIFMNKE
jgi:hypothetical protein